jgi:hypothetical protein
MANGSKGEVAYTIVETNEKADEGVIAALKNIGGVFGVRIFND